MYLFICLISLFCTEKKTKMTFAFKQNQSGVNIAHTLRL